MRTQAAAIGTGHARKRQQFAARSGEVSKASRRTTFSVSLIDRQLAQLAREQVAYLRYLRRSWKTRQHRRPARIVASASSAYDSRAQVVTWHSPTLGVAKRLHIYLPPAYHHSDQRYPVLYLLRGHEREWLHLQEDPSRAGRNVLDVYEQLLRIGRVGPMILVIPSLTSEDGAIHGLGVDHLKPWLGQQAIGVGTSKWEHYFLDDVVPLVDTNWRTLPVAAHRGVDGFSLGGAVAVKLAAKFPWLFRSVGAYDGTFFYSSADGSGVEAGDTVLHNPICEPAFGRPRNLLHATANSPVDLVRQAQQHDLLSIAWMIEFGPEHIEPWGSNYYRGAHLVEWLRKRGVANALGDGVLRDGDHTWRTADRHMATTLPLHWRVLGMGV